MLVIGPTARRIAAGCCNYILTRFPPGHDVPVCTIDQEWFADLAQKEIHAAQENDGADGEPSLTERLEDTLALVRITLAQLDDLARVWGDEGAFRSCRDRLRSIPGVVQ